LTSVAAAGRRTATSVVARSFLNFEETSVEKLLRRIDNIARSMLTDTIVGKPVEEVRHLIGLFTKMVTSAEEEPPEELGDLEAFQGVAQFPVRVKCATLAWHTLEDGLKQREAGERVAHHEE